MTEFEVMQRQTTAFVSVPVSPYPNEILSDVPPYSFWLTLALAAIMGRDYIWNHWGGKELWAQVKKGREIPKITPGMMGLAKSAIVNAVEFARPVAHVAVEFAQPVAHVSEEHIPRHTVPAAPVKAVAQKPVTYLMSNWRYLVDKPNVFIYGIPGGGKTTVARALMNARGGKALIINPKRSPDDWGEQTIMPDVVRSGFDWSGVKEVLFDLSCEVARRASLDAADLAKEETLTVVLDDLAFLSPNCEKELNDFLGTAAIIGRSMKFWLILAGQSDRAGLTGFTGKHDLLMGLPRLAMQAHQGTLLYGDYKVKVDMRGVLEASQGQRWQTIESVKPATVTEAIESLETNA